MKDLICRDFERKYNTISSWLQGREIFLKHDSKVQNIKLMNLNALNF